MGGKLLPHNDDGKNGKEKGKEKDLSDLLKMLEEKGFHFDARHIFSLGDKDAEEELKREGLVPHRRLDHKDPFGKEGTLPPWVRGIRADVTFKEKIVFLNDANLQLLKGYKAAVEMRSSIKKDRFNIHIILTDFSRKSVEWLFDQLKELPPEEVYGVNE